MFKRVFTAAIIFGAAALAPPAASQTMGRCMDRAYLTTSLAQLYGERQQGAGLQDDSHLVELWASEASGSFTLLITLPDGTSCILLAGEHWRTTIPAPAKGLTY